MLFSYTQEIYFLLEIKNANNNHNNNTTNKISSELEKCCLPLKVAEYQHLWRLFAHFLSPFCTDTKQRQKFKWSFYSSFSYWIFLKGFNFCYLFKKNHLIAKIRHWSLDNTAIKNSSKFEDFLAHVWVI